MTDSKSSFGISHTRILVVDDHPTTAQTLSRALSQLGNGVEVISATSGKIALEKVKDGAVDLLVTDMMMPEMNGLELIERLKSHPGGQPTYTILITAYDVPGLRESAKRLKVNETIIKPVRPEHLCRVVSEALGNMKHTSEPDVMDDNGKRTFKILIADDIADNVTLLARYLQGEGFDYLTASDGEETLEKIRSSMPDLILLDINMPKLDGFKVLEEIRNDPAIKHIPVIILTAARISHSDLQSGLNLGADDYVTKPFDRRELLARIRTRLRVKDNDDAILRRNRELGLLPEIGRELSARTDIHELTDLILRRTVETLGAVAGHIVLFNERAPLHKAYCRPMTGSDMPQVQLPPLNSLLSQIKESRQGLIIRDTLEDARWKTVPPDPTRSVIMIPIFGRSDLIGLLILHHERANYFNEEQQLLLQALAGQAAIAVENARLYESVSQEQHRLSAVLNSAADAILMFDSNGCLSLLNHAAEKLFTDEPAKIGLPLAQGHGYDELIALLENVFTSLEAKVGEIAWTDKRVFSALLTPIGNDGCVVVLHDVSHFKALERVKNEFIATASHDLKNPIASILGFSQIMSKAGPLNENQQDFINRIFSAASNMNELVQNLLELAKVDANVEFHQEPVDMNALMMEIMDEFEPQAKAKNQAMEFSRSEDQSWTRGDPFQLRQAFRNLVGNAIKYTPGGGVISLSIVTDQHNVIIHVKDTGHGIPADDLPHIFERFYRVRNEAVKDIEGNGLGLAIVKSIVERHGGQVGVKSEQGQGTCFTVRLPGHEQEHTETIPTGGKPEKRYRNEVKTC